MKKTTLLFLIVGGLCLGACGKPPASTVPGTKPSGPGVSPAGTLPAEGTMPVPADPGVISPTTTRRITPADVWNHPVPPADPNVIAFAAPGAAPPRPLSPRQQAVAQAARSVATAFDAQRKTALVAHAERLAAWRKRQDELKEEQKRLAASASATHADAPQTGPAATSSVLERINQELMAPQPVMADGDPDVSRRVDLLLFRFRQASAQNDAAKMADILSEIQPLAPKISQAVFAQFQGEITQYLQRAEVGTVVVPRSDGPPGPNSGGPPQ